MDNKTSKIQEALNSYNRYTAKEFGDDPIDESSINNGLLGLLYTEVGNERYEVQLTYDINNERLIATLTNKETGTEWRFSESEPIDNFIQDTYYMSYDEWYYYVHQIVEEEFNKPDIEF